MRYKVINNSTQIVQKTRADYLYEKFCIDKKLDLKTFVHRVKSAYYEYDSEVYNPDHAGKLTNLFSDLLSSKSYNTPPAIVDIGAGSGQSYELVKSTNFEFASYYFIEPFQAMVNKFEFKNDDKIVLVCDYFENKSCTELLLSDKRPKIFLMCASLRTLDNLPKFIDILKANMSINDRLILPLEPNNDYFGKYYKILVPFIYGLRIIKKFEVVGMFNRRFISNNPSKKSTLEMSLESLKQDEVVNSDFTTGMLYAIVYYNNFFTWRKIKVPEKYNDGFFTIEQVASQLGGKVTKLKTHTYLYGFSFGNKKMDDFLEKVLNKIFPKSGAVLSAVITKL